MDAQLRASAHQQKLALALRPPHEDLSLADATQLYEAFHPGSPQTRTRRAGVWNTLVRETGNPTLAGTTPRLLERWSSARTAAIAPGTIVMENREVKALFAWLTEQGHLLTSPAAWLDTKAIPPKKIEPLTYREEAALLAAHTTASRLKLLLALDAGLRASELLALRKNHFNPEEARLTVHSAKNRPTRAIPATLRLWQALSEQTAKLHPDALLFPTRTDRKEKRRRLRIRGAATRAGRPVTPHDLRRTFATRLIETGANTFVVAELLGHSTRPLRQLSTTRYVQITWEQKVEAICRMQEANPNAPNEGQKEQP